MHRKARNMIYTLTFNPSLDYMISVDDFEMNKVNRTNTELVYPGGKGINVSMVLKNLCHKSVALGFVAGFTGDAFEKLISAKGIDTDFIKVNDGMTRINVKLKTSIETEINGQGPAINKEDIEKLYNKLLSLEDGDILVLAGSIPKSVPNTIYSDIMECLKTKKINIIVDASNDLLLNVLKYHPFLVKPNNFELGEIFGVDINSKEEALKYANILKDKGARNVLVSMAKDGAVMVCEDGKEICMEAPFGEVVNSVGAGDSLVAGFIAGFEESRDYYKAIKMGVCTGSASAFSMELATKEAVEKLYNSI